MEHLIAKYLTNELTLDEQYQLSKWVHADKKNAETLQKLHSYWHLHKSDLKDEELDVRQRLHHLIEQEQASDEVNNRSTSTMLSLRIAASIAIILSIILSIAYFQSSRKEPVVAEAPTLIEKVCLPGQKITTTLPDGTVVKLNADSKLTVPSRFDGAKREVQLEGEAFFDVKRDEHRPFVIKTENLNIRVLGTSFNVRAYGDEGPQVAVRSGKVVVSNQKQSINLGIDEMASSTEGHIEKSAIPSTARPFDWTSQKLAFDNESLPQVFKKISRWYGVRIDLNEKIITKKAFTAHYNNPTIVEMMEVLSHVYNFQFEYNEKENSVLITQK